MSGGRAVCKCILQPSFLSPLITKEEKGCGDEAHRHEKRSSAPQDDCPQGLVNFFGGHFVHLLNFDFAQTGENWFFCFSAIWARLICECAVGFLPSKFTISTSSILNFDGRLLNKQTTLVKESRPNFAFYRLLLVALSFHWQPSISRIRR